MWRWRRRWFNTRTSQFKSPCFFACLFACLFACVIACQFSCCVIQPWIVIIDSCKFIIEHARDCGSLSELQPESATGRRLGYGEQRYPNREQNQTGL